MIAQIFGIAVAVGASVWTLVPLFQEAHVVHAGFCSECGEALASGAKFCAECGTPVVR